MITDRLRSAVDRAAQLPPETQDALAGALEHALDIAAQATALSSPGHTPTLAPEVRAAFERVIQRHAASLAYLKDR